MVDWSKLKVVDLKAELKRRDLPQHGLKADLVARLQDADETIKSSEEPAVQVAADEAVDESTQHVATPPSGDAIDDQAPAPEAAPEAEPSNKQSEEPVPEPIAEDEPEPAAVDSHEPEQEPVRPVEAAPTQNPNIENGTHVEDAAAEPVPEAESKEGDNRDAPAPTVEESISTSIVKETSEEAPADLQKRKRRSVSPPPTEESVSKRLRVEEADDAANGTLMSASAHDEAAGREVEDRMDTTNEAEGPQTEQDREAPPTTGDKSPSDDIADETNDSDLDQAIDPSMHPATSALYITNLMRPMRPADIQTHLIDLATPRSAPLRNDIIVDFHLDQIKTHAFVVFTSKSAASRVRTLLHGSVWPNESNRKALFVDFVPPESVKGWIEQETGKDAIRGTRWEINYSAGRDGVEARLQPVNMLPSRTTAGPPTGPSGERRGPPPAGPGGANSIPVGPRSFLREPPTGPRPKNSGPGPRPPPRSFDNPTSDQRVTRSGPPISYQPVSRGLAERRLSNMRSYYKPGMSRAEMGRQYNRYSFQQGDVFVDRGKEVFEGIRPPHRERAMRGGRGFGGGRRGGPPMRPRGGDSYVPGGGGDRRGYARDNRDRRR